MEENMVVIIDPKTFYFDFVWSEDVDENLKHKIEIIVKSNESLAENKKTRLYNNCLNISMGRIFINSGNRETNEPNKFVLNL